VEEAASGVKGSIAVKVFGKDLYKSEKIAVQIDKILSTVQGIEDLGVIRNIGQPELRIELNEQSLARYGVAKEDVHHRNGYRRKIGITALRRRAEVQHHGTL
jgi:cobalt-zinc-cadmium resistance protein CzcA